MTTTEAKAGEAARQTMRELIDTVTQSRTALGYNLSALVDLGYGAHREGPALLAYIDSLSARVERLEKALREVDEIAQSNGVEDLAMGDLLDQMVLIGRIIVAALTPKAQP